MNKGGVDLSYDVQLFTQCDHVVDDEFYGMRISSTQQRVVSGGTMLYNYEGQWITELPQNTPTSMYVPILTVPSGTIQYYYDNNWNNALPQSMVSNNTDYVFILASNSQNGEFTYYYYNSAVGDYAWNNSLPNNANVTYIPVIPRSQVTTEYYYNNDWSEVYPDLSASTIYVSSAEFGTNTTQYYYNNTWSTIEPENLVFVNIRYTSYGAQQYYYNGVWNNTAPINASGQVYVYTQSLPGGSGEQYYYNSSWNAEKPSGFTVIKTRFLLSQNLTYYYDGIMQDTPPNTITSPMIIFKRSNNGVYEYEYNGDWQGDMPLATNEVFTIENANYNQPYSTNITTAYYYQNNWQMQAPIILSPSINIIVSVQKDGTLLFNYNGADNPYPPTELLIVEQRTLEEPMNQYYVNGTWESTAPTASTQTNIYFLQTQVAKGTHTQYYYNNQWNDTPQYKFDASLCPKCYGEGYYYDISFNTSGQALLSTGDIKLQQELLKVMIDEKGGNVFHPQWGDAIQKKLLGHKNLTYTAGKLQFMVSSTLQYLQQLQLAAHKKWGNILPDEMIGSINYVIVSAAGPTGYNVQVSITSAAGVTKAIDMQL